MSSGLAETLFPPIGTMLIDSVPPATATSYIPAAIDWATWAMDCTPELQKRLMVIAGTVSGSPARSAACRATFMPCSASGIAQPSTTSSTAEGWSPGTAATAARMATAARVSGRVSLNSPLRARVKGVRTALAMTTREAMVVVLLML